MKISKWEFAVIMLGVVFLAFTAGWFVRSASLTGPVRVEVEGKAAEYTLKLEPETERPAPSGGKRPEGPVNINTAGAEELMTLPGVGEKRAADIIAEREENGPYRFPEDITRVSGIGEETLAGLIDYIITEEMP